MPSAFQIRTKLGVKSSEEVKRRGRDVRVIEGDLAVRIGSTYLGQTVSDDSPIWLRDAYLDDFAMSLINAVTALDDNAKNVSVELMSFILGVHIDREGGKLRISQVVNAPEGQEVPAFVPIERVPVSLEAFRAEVGRAVIELVSRIAMVNRDALESETLVQLVKAAKDAGFALPLSSAS